MIGVRLAFVPNLADITKHNVTTAIKSDNSLGAFNVPQILKDSKKVLLHVYMMRSVEHTSCLLVGAEARQVHNHFC